MLRGRIGWVLAATVLSGGCYDFEGELGKLGFESNLVVDGIEWARNAAIADGTEARFVASQRLDDQKGLDVVGTARGVDLVSADGASITVTGSGEKGQISFAPPVPGDPAADAAVTDRFDVRFARATHVSWQHFIGGEVGELQVLAGAVVPVIPAVRDRRGRPLAYAFDEAEGPDFDVTADGAGSLWYDQGAFGLEAGDAGRIELDVERNGVALDADDVIVVQPDEVVGVDLVAMVPRSGTCGVLAVGRTEDGRQVLGAAVVEADVPEDQHPIPDLVLWSCDAPAPAAYAARVDR